MIEKLRWTIGAGLLTASALLTIHACEDPTNLSPAGGAVLARILFPERDTSVNPGDNVGFQGSATGGRAPYSYQWGINLGAPYSSTEKDPPPVAFPNIGAFTADFTVTDANNDTSTDKRRVNVTQWRHADYTLDNWSLFNGKSAHFMVFDNTNKLVNHTRINPSAFDTGQRWVLIPRCVPPGSGNSLFAWIDDDANASWDATDPSFMFMIPDATGTFQITIPGINLAPATPPNFTQGQPFTIFLNGLIQYQGLDIVGRFIENDTGHTVGQFYLDNITDQQVANVTGVVQNGTDYRLMWFIDADMDATWEMMEMGYKLEKTASGVFLESFSPSAPGNFVEGFFAEFEVIF